MATANGSSVGATPTQRDLQSIPFRGHTVYVWRQPEPTKHAFAWRVVRDIDQREVAEAHAESYADAWGAALSSVSAGGTQPEATVRDRLDAVDAISEARHILRFLRAVGLPDDVPQEYESEGYRFILSDIYGRLEFALDGLGEKATEVHHG